MGAAARVTAVALAAGALAGTPPAAKDTWLAVETPRLQIVSNASESAAIEVAQKLDRFVEALSSIVEIDPPVDVPLPVLAFKDDSSFAPFRPRANGAPLNVSGYFQRDEDESFAALSLHAAGDEQPYRAIFHEYTHALTARAGAAWPLWLYEGLAEFCSTFESRGRQIVLGRPVTRHVHALEQRTIPPLRAVVAVGRSSPQSAESRDPMFYAESWALVHYLIASDAGRRARPLRALVDRLAGGMEPQTALEQAVGSDLAHLERDLRAYIAQARYSPVVSSSTRTETQTTLTVRRVADPEADVWLGSRLMRIGQPLEAQAYLGRAQSADPRTPRLDESLGFLALTTDKYEEALSHFVRAIAQDSANPLAHYYYAETLRRRATARGAVLPADVARAMAPGLRAAIRLRPSFARAHYLLGYVQLVTGDDLIEGIDALQTAIRLAPPNHAALLTLASIELKVRDYADARKNAQTLVEAPDADEAIKADARRVLAAVSQGLGGR
jgi:tetratricopeptide (TPR) repeat protein